MEKGTRAELLGSNPHSKGDILSRVIMSFLLRIVLTQIRTKGRKEASIVVRIIISSLLKALLIGNQIYLIY